MKTLFKTAGLLLGFFLLLCITIKDKPLFTYIYDVISPGTKYAQEATEGFFSRSVSSTHTYSKKLFDNSVPKVRDTVKSKLSSNKKMVVIEERISEEDKQELDQLIKNH